MLIVRCGHGGEPVMFHQGSIPESVSLQMKGSAKHQYAFNFSRAFFVFSILLLYSMSLWKKASAENLLP